MPLHLLGKKSWNVYNQENVARVQRDEAKARATEEEEERRMQEADSERRLRILRGEDPESKMDAAEPNIKEKESDFPERPQRKRRRLAGEDDTDREIRIALEDNAAVAKVSKISRALTSETLLDTNGNISLIPQPQRLRLGKNEEAEAEAAKKNRELEDQYTMRFSNASGNKPGSDRPWYTGSAPIKDGQVVSKDVWGNEDPGRVERERKRLASGDPLAAMKQGVRKLREAEQHRNAWKAQRERDLYEVEELARKEEKLRRRRAVSEESLEGFDLDRDFKDAKTEESQNDVPREPRRQAHDHGHRQRQRRRDDGQQVRSRDRHRHRHHDRHKSGSRGEEENDRRKGNARDIKSKAETS